MRREHLAMVVVTIAAVGIYLQTHGHHFAPTDDAEYVHANPHVNTGLTLANIKWAFTAFHSSNWHPLTWISHMIDVQLFGMHAGAMKLHNVVLHLINTWLVFWIIASFSERTAGAGGAGGAPSVQPLRGDQQHHHHWCAVFCAAVFALHPLHVESVAWVSERKDVLSTAFGFAALLVWIHHTRRPSVMRYAATLALFAASLMSKPMFVTLPCVMLLIDWWFPRKGKLRWVIIEKIPMFALVAASCVLTYMAQHAGKAVMSLDRIPLDARLGNAVVSYVIYAWKTINPAGLMLFYRHPGHRPAAEILGAAALLALVSALVIAQAKRRPHLLVGWFWFLGTLVPVIGIVQVGNQSMADRYMYVPMVGLLIMAGGLGVEMARRTPQAGRLMRLVVPLVLVVLAISSALQISYWRTPHALYAHMLTHDPDNWAALDGMGNLMSSAGESERAVEYFRRALEVNPKLGDTWASLGSEYMVMNMLDEANHCAGQLAELNPGHDGLYILRGQIAARRGHHARAIEEFAVALKLDPADHWTRVDLARSLMATGDFNAAEQHLADAIRLAPRHAAAHVELGNVSLARKQYTQAIQHFEHALQLDPRSQPAAMGLQRATELSQGKPSP